MLCFLNVFLMVNSVLNLIVYGMFNVEFKKVFKSFFNCECYKFDDVCNMYGFWVLNFLKRIGKCRLMMYK